MRRALEFDQRAGQASAGAIQEQPQPQSFGALGGDQTHLAADVVDIVEVIDLRLVELGIPFQTLDPLFNGFTETRADFETFLSGARAGHGATSLGNFLGREKILSWRSQVFFLNADSSDVPFSAPDNGVAEPE
jgi:hypothetical protein